MCYNDARQSTEPGAGDWSTGNQIYNNDVKNAKFYMSLIKDSKIHHNTIDNSTSLKSAVGNTSYWWNNVEFYENTLNMQTIAWKTIAIEVWMVENNTIFHNNWTNGWFSIIYNPNGPNTPYSWQIVNNKFISNVPKGIGSNPVDGAIESCYWAKNVLVAGNYIANTGSNMTYKLGVGVWGYGDQHEITIRNNTFYNMGWAGILLQSTDTSGIYPNLYNIYVYNNVFDFPSPGGAAVFMNDGPGNINNITIKNNIVINGDAADTNPSTNNITGVVVTNNDVNGGAYSSGSGFSNVSNNYNFYPDIQATGNRPDPFYRPKSSTSNFIDKGTSVGLPYSGSAPDIGAYEYMLQLTPPTTPSLVH
jgi:hypothetical protein